MHCEPYAGRCNARTRNGGYCRNWPTHHNGRRCRMHGGSVGSGRPIKTGLYSEAVKASLRGKLAALAADPAYQDTREEIALERLLFTDYLATLQERALTVADLAGIFGFVDAITRSCERASRAQARSALTGAEVAFLRARILYLLRDMLSIEQRQELSRRWSEIIEGRTIDELPEPEIDANLGRWRSEEDRRRAENA